jgi:hypothetical protein
VFRPHQGSANWSPGARALVATTEGLTPRAEIKLPDDLWTGPEAALTDNFRCVTTMAFLK